MTAASQGDDVSRALERRLRRETQGEVLFDAAARGRYAADASIYQVMPVGVLVPRTEQDVLTAIEIARELHVPILPRGAGTSQCGQTVGAALVIDGSKSLRNLLELDVQGRTAVVQPGMVLDHLNAQLKPHGLWFPVDVSTGAQATLGGMAGNNSCGSRSIAYGNMVHNVLAATAWLSDGSAVAFGPVSSLSGRGAQIAQFVRTLAAKHRDDIKAHWPKVLRRVAGYNLDIFHPQSERPYTADERVNLAHLLIGSEGTLAYTQTLTLQLAQLPSNRVLGVVNFPTFQAAMRAAQFIVELGPTAVELVDRTMIDLSLRNPEFHPVMAAVLKDDPAAILLVEFAGSDAQVLHSSLKQLTALMGDHDAAATVVELVDAPSQSRLWEVRKAGLNIMMSLRGDGKPVSFIEDCAVPLEHLADYTQALTEVFARHGTRGTWYAHASVGTLHVRPILDMRRDGPGGGAARMRAIAEEAAVLVRKYRGAFSGEHGDGLCRGEWIEWQFGKALTQAFAQIKRNLDPIGLFNPGKIIAPPKMDDVSLFRFAPPSAPHPYRITALRPAFDWSAWNVQNDPVSGQVSAPGTGADPAGGFAKAVEMCNNNGHCRKFDAAVMCPSYRVTRDEQHLTRGRANTLRLALAGELGPEGLTGEPLRQALDLCVGCKACKRECPTGVDMARMKLEFLVQYKAQRGFTLQDRLIGELPAYAAFASRHARLANLRDRMPGAAWLSEKLVGFAAARPLPKWRRDTFWTARDAPLFCSAAQLLEAAKQGKKTAVLFVDTFNGTFEPANALAAARVLRACGYMLHTPTRAGAHYCCGRTYLSTGMFEKARATLHSLLAALEPFASQGVPIVGLEPACLLTLRDEALVMGLGESARVVAEQALLFEEFLAREVKAGRCHLALKALSVPVLVHGHCHQKSFGAVTPILEVLRAIPGSQPQLIASSCCGMAGSFGYEAAHQEVSMQMAEAALLPAIRAVPEAIVVADGSSCRQQISDGAQREALHAARLLDQLLAPAR
jgi:FAD/FMN-containing dehydrogenase/Fe-S oxidoreductase